MRVNEAAAAAFLAVALFAVSCGTESETSDDVCGAGGEEVSVDSERYCVYEQAVVVENGFDCPPHMPNLTEAGGIGICSSQKMLPVSEVERIAERYRERHPAFEGCILDAECSGTMECDRGMCNTRKPGTGNNQTNNGSNNGTNNDSGGDTNNGTNNDPGDTNNANNGAECSTGSGECAFDEVCDDGVCAPACGGFVGHVCPDPAAQWCDFADDEACGISDFIGTCRARPDACTDEYDPVCGCDGMTYSNGCQARAAGVDVLGGGECS